MDRTVSKKWDVRIKSILLLLLSLFLTQVILSNSFITETPYLTHITSFSYFFSGFHQYTENRFSPFLFIVGYYLISPRQNDIVAQSLFFGATMIISTFVFASNSSSLNAYFINTLLFFCLLLISFENLFSRKLKIEGSRYLFMLVAGTLHGGLFAGNLLNTEMAGKFTFSSVAIYNSGLLLGFLGILSVLYILVVMFAAKKDYYKKWVVNPVSILIGVYALSQIAEMLFSKN